MFYTVRFEGHLRALTPLATSPPNTPPAAHGGRPPTPLPRMTATLANGETAEVPYFPGGGLRGTLRRRAVSVIADALSETAGKPPFDIDTYYYLALGGVKGSEGESKADIHAAEQRRRQNPLIALFGAGAPWDRSRLLVGSAVPTVPLEPLIVRGARRDDFSVDSNAQRWVSEEERARWLEMARNNAERSRKRLRVAAIDQRLPSAEQDDALRLTQERERLEREIEEHTRLSFSAVSVSRPLDGYEAIPPGTMLSHAMTLRQVTMTEIGLTVAALRRWALDPHIGAHIAQDCGLTEGRWSVSIWSPGTAAYETQGEFSLKPFVGIDASPAVLVEAEAAFMNALTSPERGFDFRAP